MQRFKTQARLYFALGLGLLAAESSQAQGSVLAEIDDLKPGEIAVRGFELHSAQDVQIEGWRLIDRHRSKKSLQLASAWILNAESREVVWTLEEVRSGKRHQDLSEVEDSVRLERGTYEVYYATFPTDRWRGDGEGWWESASRSVSRMFGWNEDYDDAVAGLELTVRGRGRKVNDPAIARIHSLLRDKSVVAVAATEHDFKETQGFTLKEPAKLKLYAVGELTDDGDGFDFGWIVDTRTREKVWRFRYDGSARAGGAGKNRMVRETLSLPAGEYAAYFVTDGSHSPRGWNALPPRDPAFWGLTLWLDDPAQAKIVERTESRHLPPDSQAIAELVRLRDDEQKSYGFTLSSPLDVQIYAVGEGYEHDMADYGWIVNARTREKVWAMDYARTEHAGGSSKNRVVDEILHLEPGSYIVSFVTDDSHAYRDWNADPPAYPERWGITLFGGEGFDPATVKVYRQDEDPAVVARIARVKSGSHRRHEFKLEEPAEVSVYALGEGTGGNMYDYAWLEDARGKVVWEMTYPMTDGAGGASKNRLYHGLLELPAGSYVLHYRTDDSHAYREWNASPPNDPDFWGVQIAVVE